MRQQYSNMNTVDIKTLKNELLFTHSVEDNTILKTLEKAVLHKVNLKDADLRDADLRDADLTGAKYTKQQIDSAITDETTIF